MEIFRAILWCVIFLPPDLVLCTWRYYGSYTIYGSGDTMITTYHMHGGPQIPNRKWNVECLDGEAMVGIADWWDDYERFEQIWCKFTFPNKPATNGLYPYYSGCHVRNFTGQPFCLNALDVQKTGNTFVTALWNVSYFWFLFRAGADDNQPMKCCKTPPGYYIDYMSCYYLATHDPFFEYYDNTFNFITYCSQGYVITGMGRKLNQYSHEYQLDFIQCCRVGMGQVYGQQPPVIYTKSGAPVIYAPGNSSPPPMSAAYQAQYRSDADDDVFERRFDPSTNQTVARRVSSGQTPDPEARPELHHLLLKTEREKTTRKNLRKSESGKDSLPPVKQRPVRPVTAPPYER